MSEQPEASNLAIAIQLIIGLIGLVIVVFLVRGCMSTGRNLSDCQRNGYALFRQVEGRNPTQAEGKGITDECIKNPAAFN